MMKYLIISLKFFRPSAKLRTNFANTPTTGIKFFEKTAPSTELVVMINALRI